MEVKETLSPTACIALQRLVKKIKSLDEEFKTKHFVMVELLDQKEDLTREQTALDEHDNQEADLSDRVEMIEATCFEI